MRALLAAALVAALLALAACGGGSGHRGYTTARGYASPRGYGIVGSSQFRVQPGLLDPAVSSAGQVVTAEYRPTGRIVADSGFRPQADGFAFENYGNEEHPTNLTRQSMQDLFGAHLACLPGTAGSACVLNPAAEQWMENQNEQMAGGHCEGFSITALRMWAQHLRVSDFGAATVPALEIRGNTPLQSQIAEDFVYQGLPAVLRGKLSGPPSAVVRFLARVLPLHRELYTLGIFKADGSGGHAITPYAIEDKGGGRYAILVYDNNFPGETRAVQVDANDETWRYVGGSNPHDLNEVYRGAPGTPPLELDPTTPGERRQPCVFCSAEQAAAGKGGSLLPPSQRYNEITLTGDPANHPHLVFSDDQGRITGFYHGRLVQQIPDVQVVKTYATTDWNQAPEPSYRFPQGRSYVINIDGEDLDRTAHPEINLIGNGIVVDVDDVSLAPGQVDRMQITTQGYGLTYESNTKKDEAPNIYAGVQEGASSYIFAASAVGIQRGSAISLEVFPKDKVVVLDSARARGVGGQKAYYIVNLTKKTGNGPIGTWTKAVRLSGAKGEKVGFEYAKTAVVGRPLPLVFVGADGNPTGRVILLKPGS